MKIRCQDCGREWTALGQAHCAACHEHFNSDYAFDRHREGVFAAPGQFRGDRRCIPVERLTEPYGKAKRPRLMRSGTTSHPVWITAKMGSTAHAVGDSE